jgi:GTP-binding protein
VIEKYLRTRKSLADIFLLIDSRHGILPNDEQMIEFLDHYRIGYKPVFTKTDKLTKTELSAARQKNQGSFFASAADGTGKEELLDHIRQILESGEVKE